MDVDFYDGGSKNGKWTVKLEASALCRIVPDRIHEPIPYLERSEGDVGNL